VDLQLDDIRRRLATREILVEVTDDARRFIAREAFDPVYGARPLKRYLQRAVETRVARAIIGGDVADGSAIEIVVENDDLEVRTAAGAPTAS
jgi:ATP-dependent Clp protease ATP-binding subunit ClpB